MGFLSASGYEGTEEIDLGNGYWVRVKKCLSAAEAGFVESAMMGKQRLNLTGGDQFAEVDARASRSEMVVQSLDSWNLDDEDGKLMPLGAGLAAGRVLRPGENPYPPGCPRRTSVAWLPSPAFDQVWEKCDELNAPRKGTEAASFPDEAERGDQDGDDTAAGPGPVPD